MITLEGGSILRRIVMWQAGLGLSELMREAVDPDLLTENLKWCQRQFWPGVIAIVLTGAGQKCDEKAPVFLSSHLQSVQYLSLYFSVCEAIYIFLFSMEKQANT